MNLSNIINNLDAYCVLICVTEKYRQSLNCQAEAQYAFKLNKHIIPLVMEKGYENCKGNPNRKEIKHIICTKQILTLTILKAG